MDGGIGESLLLENVLQGAIVGGGISALTGGDFLTGALTGGVGGGIKGFLPDFTKIFAPSGVTATAATPAEMGTKIATSAVPDYTAPAFGTNIATSPFGTSEVIGATSPWTAGTSNIANIAKDAYTGDLFEIGRAHV